MTSAERLAPAGLVLGEGPIRLDAHLYACVDIRGHTIHEGDLDGGFAETHRFDTNVTAICLLDDGDLLAAVGTSIEVVGRPDRTIDLPAQAPDIRLNDGKADPAGRFLAGTMADPPRTGAGTFWSFHDNRATLLLSDVTISNGLCWNDTGDTLYYVDTPTRRIDAFDYHLDTGLIDSRRTVATIADGLGHPDGMTIDADGGLWVAMWGGSAVLRYQNGEITDRIEVPTPYVTCPVFVGAEHDTLLITTASEPIPGEPGAGDIYVADPGVTGAPACTPTASTVFGQLDG
jgi:sugar lactone lactonase YvrE